MKFFVDTAEISEIKSLNSLGLVDGVTTNPSLIFKSGKDIKETIKAIAKLVDGPVSAEVVAEDYEGMMEQADSLLKLGDNICIKLPMTLAGLRACRTLSSKEIMTNVTLCFSANQAVLAAKAGASFVSPFVGRLDDVGAVGMDLISDIRIIFDNYNFKTEIIVASIRSHEHIQESALLGSDVVTVPPKLLLSLIEHPLTDKGLKAFSEDWKKTGQVID